MSKRFSPVRSFLLTCAAGSCAVVSASGAEIGTIFCKNNTSHALNVWVDGHYQGLQLQEDLRALEDRRVNGDNRMDKGLAGERDALAAARLNLDKARRGNDIPGTPGYYSHGPNHSGPASWVPGEHGRYEMRAGALRAEKAERERSRRAQELADRHAREDAQDPWASPRLETVVLFELGGHTDSVYSAAFSPDGARIVTASDDNTARVWGRQRRP